MNHKNFIKILQLDGQSSYERHGSFETWVETLYDGLDLARIEHFIEEDVPQPREKRSGSRPLDRRSSLCCLIHQLIHEIDKANSRRT